MLPECNAVCLNPGLLRVPAPSDSPCARDARAEAAARFLGHAAAAVRVVGCPCSSEALGRSPCAPGCSALLSSTAACPSALPRASRPAGQALGPRRPAPLRRISFTKHHSLVRPRRVRSGDQAPGAGDGDVVAEARGVGRGHRCVRRRLQP